MFQNKLVKKAFLFGSVSRNDEDDLSDVDILVELDYSQPIGLGFVRMKFELEDLSDYDGSNRTSILTTSGPLLSMAAGSGYVFYSFLNSPYSVRRCNSDGTGDTQLYVNPSYGSVYNLAYDAVNNYLYHYELSYDASSHNRIFRWK